MEYRIDLFAVFILLGIVQAVFLSYFFLSKDSRRIRPNRYQGYFLLAVAAVVLEIFLMYTGYILDVIHLVDFSEPLAFLIGPMIYFIVVSSIDPDLPKRPWPHYVLPVGYFLYNILLIIQPEAVKYNAYLDAYHPEMTRIPEEMIYTDDPLNIRSLHTELVIVSVLSYTLLSFIKYFRYTRERAISFWHSHDKLIRRSRNYLFISIGMLAVILISKSIYDYDLGDHFIATVMSVMIYFTSFELIRSSTLLTGMQANKRYHKSSLSGEMKSEMIDKVVKVLETDQRHLSIGFGLADLSAAGGASTHHLSEVINEGFGKSFFDLIAEYRIKAACELLESDYGKKIKMEEVAEQVGYSSKSSFNTQFKKITGMTPSAYRNKLE